MAASLSNSTGLSWQQSYSWYEINIFNTPLEKLRLSQLLWWENNHTDHIYTTLRRSVYLFFLIYKCLPERMFFIFQWNTLSMLWLCKLSMKCSQEVVDRVKYHHKSVCIAYQVLQNLLLNQVLQSKPRLTQEQLQSWDTWYILGLTLAHLLSCLIIAPQTFWVKKR